MRRHTSTAFTIIELLVVVSIIALLIGILLPAIGKARDSARQTVSQTNLRNMATAHANYAADWNDRQLTTVNDNIGSYGSSSAQAFPSFLALNGVGHPNIVAGWGPVDDGSASGMHLYRYILDGTFGAHHGWAGNAIHWYGGSGSIIYGFGRFRFPNIQAFHQYLSGRWYAPEFYAPKDTQAYACAEKAFETPYEVVPQSLLPCASAHVWTSYCLSPAGMLSPQVFSLDDATGLYYKDPWSMGAGLRTPGMGQARFPALKTHMVEHHWLQNRRTECNPNSEGGSYDGCEPYYFNHGWQSSPLTLFYDGHVGQIGVRTAELADARMDHQSGHGLWTRDTPFSADGYFIEFGYDQANTSFHILTTDGILGRDTLSE
jgi:type II secretory pathway pseudopilin PulG